MKKGGVFALYLFLSLLIVFLPGSDSAFAQNIQAESLAAISPIVEEAIREGQTPGAVVLVGHQGKVVFRHAFGHRAYTLPGEAMTVDTLFDVIPSKRS